MRCESVAFHIGSPRAGSSYAQSWLEHRRQALLGEGLDYPYVPSRPGPRPGSGNANAAVEALVNRKDPAVLCELIEGALAPKVVLSCENFHYLVGHEGLTVLETAFRQMGVEVHFHFLLRNYLDFALSAFALEVAHGGQSGDMTTYLSDLKLPWVALYSELSGLFGEDNLSFYAYDAYRHDLDDWLTHKVLGLTVAPRAPRHGFRSPPRVNRALEAWEVDLCLMWNRLHPERASKSPTLGDALGMMEPLGAGGLRPTAEQVGQAMRRFSSDVEFFNAGRLRGGRVSIASPALVAGSNRVRALAEPIAPSQAWSLLSHLTPEQERRGLLALALLG